MTEKLPTGIEVLDRRLGGGLRSGHIVMLSAAPTSQSELFLSRLTHARRTLYLTTRRSESAVLSALERTDAHMPNCAVRRVDSDAPVEHSRRLIEVATEEINAVIDPMDVLEAVESERLGAFLNAVRDHLDETGGIAFLHCLDGRVVPAGRDTTEYMVDVVFDLETDVQGDQIRNRLFVPKVRGGRPITDAIKLDLTDGVTIDTSRDIA